MRCLVVMACLLFPSGAFAQSHLLDPIQLLDSTLVATVAASFHVSCSDPAPATPSLPRTIGCGAEGFTHSAFAASDGSLYAIDLVSQLTCNGQVLDSYNRLVRVKPDGTLDEVARFETNRCLECAGDSCVHSRAGSATWTYDVTTGILLVRAYAQEANQNGSPGYPAEYGLVKISGFPSMFDTQLTFAPGGSLSMLIPAKPDGFAAADSLQVWTGPLGSMPDWSQAQPLACEAATSMTPGQLVTVADTLPDPPVGAGRYYITAAQHSGDRRLGRQYVNRAFSARDPSSLPICAQRSFR